MYFLRQLQNERGTALVLVLGMLVVLSITSATLTYYATANTQSAALSKSEETSYSLAEAGMAEALSKLGAADEPTDGALLPSTTVSYETGTATYAGALSGSTWTLTSTGKATNPTGSSGPAQRTVTRTVEINGPNVGSLSPYWTRLFNASILGCFDVPVNIPVTVASYLCIDVEPTGSITGANSTVSTGWWIRQRGTGGLTAQGSPGSAVDNGTGTVWANPGNVVTSDNNKATVTVSGSATTHNIDATAFGLSIPAGSQIDGVTVHVERMASSSSSIRDYDVYLVKGGATIGSDRSSSSYWPTFDGNATYGGSSDDWNTSLTAADVNASDFGVRLKARNYSSSSRTASVDHIDLTVTYTGPPHGIGTPGTPVAQVNAPGGCYVNGGGNSDPCTSSDFVFSNSINENWAVGIKPWTSFNFWWRNTKPGPKNACTNTSGTPRVFDNDAVSTTHPNDSNPTQEITPETVDYTCQYRDSQDNVVGELSWDRATRVLTVKGTIFFDGSITFGDAGAGPVHYHGRGTIWTSGDVTISEPVCAGGSGSDNCRTNISSWDPESNLLILIAGGEQSWFSTDITVNQSTSAFQGALYARNDCDLNNAPMISAPILCTRIDINSTSVSINPWPAFPTAKGGQLYADGTEGDMQLVIGQQAS